MKRILLLLVLLLPLGLLAQSRFYRGNSTYSGNILYTLDGAIPIAVLVAFLL